ncbi:hypothetical protein BG005_008819 [Podila minutissima]|nr:hypothetical protein BG005_008819 [Podila minutissima]
MIQVAGQVTVVSSAAYTRFGTKLYAVGGGFTREIPKKYGHLSGGETAVGDGQFIVLDLSVPWDGANPPWKKLANGPKQYNLPAAFNNDGTKLAAFHGPANSPFGMVYDVASGTWSNSTVVVPKPDREGIPGITDPEKNIMYLATGYEANGKDDAMYMYNFSNDKMEMISMNGAPIMGRAYFAGAWNAKTKSIMYFGGNMASGDNAPTGIHTYTPSTYAWATLVTTADDGSKLIVHGGRATTKPFDQWLLGDINILDLTTNQWTQGRTYVKPRMNPVCTLINDTFISWGGSDDGQTVGNQAILYDVKRDKYLSKYMGPDPDSDYDPLVGIQKNKPSSGSGSSGSGSGSGSDSESPNGRFGMIAGIVAAVVVLGGLGLYVRYKMVSRHQDQRQQVIDMLEKHQNNASKPNNGSRPTGPTGGANGAHPVSQKPLPVQPAASRVSPNRASVAPVSAVTMVEPLRTGGYQHYQYTAQSQPTQVPLPYPQMGSSSPHQLPSAPAQSPLPYPQMGSPSPFRQHAQVPSSPIPRLSMQKQEDPSFSAPPQYVANPMPARSRGPQHIPDFPNS